MRPAILLALAAASLAAQQAPNQIPIPGSRDALAFVAHGKQGAPPDRFLADFSRAVVENTSSNNLQANAAYLDRLQQYFRRLAALEMLGARSGDRLTVTLAFDQRNSGPTEQILNLLGWKSRQMDRRAKLQADETTALGRRQEANVALNVDAIALQQAFEEHKRFTFDIVNEPAAILLDEDAWRREFYPNEKLAGGFAQALVRDPRIARAYAGLSALDGETLAAVVHAIGLKNLAWKYSPQLYRYSSALLVTNGKIEVPGGPAAEPHWQKLVGAAPSDPDRFLRTLVDAEAGLAMTFYFAVAQYDAAHQRFWASDDRRLSALYDLFKRNPASRVAASGKMVRGPGEVGLLGEVALGAGRVKFPGGVEVWNHGQPGTDADVLLRLARGSFTRLRMAHSDLETLVDVMRIDATRAERLDAPSAALLARNYPDAGTTYGYFRVLTTLRQPDFERFFAVLERARRVAPADVNIVVGQLEALVEFLCLGRRAGTMDDRQAAAEFATLCYALSKAESAGDFTAASLDFVARLAKNRGANADDAIRDLLLGVREPVTLEVGGAQRRLDVTEIERERYARVLEAQRIPSLALLLELREAVAGGRDVEPLCARIPSAPIPEVRVMAAERASLAAFDPRRIAHAAAAQGEAPRERLNRALTAMAPQTMLALAGRIYASYLSPDDLLVSEDPLLPRKHRFVYLGALDEGGIVVTNEGAGSAITGGFAEFSAVAGKLAAGPGGSVRAFVDAQMAALRQPEWRWPAQEEFRDIGKKVQAGRDWIEAAAKDPALAASLADVTVGLLSPSRRGILLAAIRTGDWPKAWQAVTQADLYRIGSRRLNSDTPWAARGGPYEDYERYTDPARMAERAAELQFYLADAMERAGVPPAGLHAIAEPLARSLFEDLKIADERDWRSVLAAFQGIRKETIQEALPKP